MTTKREIEAKHAKAIRLADAEFLASYRTHRIDRAATATDEERRNTAYVAANKARREALAALGVVA